jgi:hypothetical protein
MRNPSPRETLDITSAIQRGKVGQSQDSTMILSLPPSGIGPRKKSHGTIVTSIPNISPTSQLNSKYKMFRGLENSTTET